MSELPDHTPDGAPFEETLAGNESGPPSVGHADTLHDRAEGAEGGERADRDLLTSQPSGPADPEDQPQRIGKYRVLHRLGEGGMGTVFAAHDEELDREIAIKLVKPQLRDGGESATTRLLREAKALAKISHPNVIHVYEVGTWRNRIFVAMELVDGWTLGRFQYRNVTSWQGLLEIYKAAGRGLAAAHLGGLIHRDFKPDNVLVTRDGEPRVIDFGLARTIGVSGLEEEAAERPDLDLGAEIQLTRTGVVLGTPAYMAPEQHKGEATDARTDQFSFCVALYEALYAQRPFAGANYAELMRNVLAGNIEEPPPFIKVPGWIRRVLKRGLSVDPNLRYPSMEALLDALEHDPARRWRVMATLFGVAAVLTVAALSWRTVETRRIRRIEAEQVRAEFDAQRLRDQEQQIRSAQDRDLPARQNQFVVAAARARLQTDPAAALAILEHLDPRDESNLPAAAAVAGEALARGVVELDLQLPSALERAVFSPSGRVVVVADDVGTVRLIQCGSGAISTIAQVAAPVVGLAFIAEDARLAIADGAGALHLVTGVDRGADATTTVRRAHTGPITALAVAPTGERLALGGDDGLVTVWRADTGELERRLLGHTAAITALTFAEDDDLLFTADASGRLYGRNLEQSSRRVLEEAQVVDGLAILAGQVTGWRGGTVWSWDNPSAKRRVLVEPDSSQDPRHAHVAVVKDALAFVDQGGTLWMRTEDQRRPVIADLPTWTGAFAVGPDHLRVALGDEQGRFVLRRLGDRSGLHRFGEQERPIEAFALANAGPGVALGQWNGQVLLYDLGREQQTPLADGLPGGVALLAFSPTDQHLIGTHARSRRLWALDTGDSIALPEGRCDAKAVTWSDDGGHVAIVQCDIAGFIEVFDTLGQREFSWHAPEVEAVLLHPAGTSMLVTGAEGVALSHVDLGTRVIEPLELADTPAGSESKVVAFAFVDAPIPGVRVATHEGDRLRVWHWDPGEGELHPLSDEPVAGPPWTTPDHRFLLLPLEGELLRHWDLERNHAVLLTGIGHGVTGFRVSADRSTLLINLSSAADPTALRLHLPSGASRPFVGPYQQVSGDGASLGGRSGAAVELWRDPVPPSMAVFLVWLDGLRTQTVSAETLFGE